MAKAKKPSSGNRMPTRSVKIEDALMNSLKNSGLERAHLSELVSVASKLGVVPIKGFPYGIPDPQGIVIEANLNPQQLASLMGRLGQYSNVDRVTIFPKGIPQLSEFLTQIQFQ